MKYEGHTVTAKLFSIAESLDLPELAGRYYSQTLPANSVLPALVLISTAVTPKRLVATYPYPAKVDYAFALAVRVYDSKTTAGDKLHQWLASIEALFVNTVFQVTFTDSRVYRGVMLWVESASIGNIENASFGQLPLRVQLTQI